MYFSLLFLIHVLLIIIFLGQEQHAKGIFYTYYVVT